MFAGRTGNFIGFVMMWLIFIENGSDHRACPVSYGLIIVFVLSFAIT